MQISTRSRYGLRALVAMSRQDGGTLSCEEIAEKEDISKKYLDRILAALRRASLIESRRGQGGGYYLARRPDEIRLDEVVSVLERGLEIIPCLEDPSGCERAGSCRARDVWHTVALALEGALGEITLADISADEA
ncbi:MAG: Rrf2 family transcriptional regulator [Candidatus Krumholzibacteriales bacterium]